MGVFIVSLSGNKLIKGRKSNGNKLIKGRKSK